MLGFEIQAILSFFILGAGTSPLQGSNEPLSPYAGGFVSEIRRSFRQGSPVGKTGSMGIFDSTYAVRFLYL